MSVGYQPTTDPKLFKALNQLKRQQQEELNAKPQQKRFQSELTTPIVEATEGKQRLQRQMTEISNEQNQKDGTRRGVSSSGISVKKTQNQIEKELLSELSALEGSGSIKAVKKQPVKKVQQEVPQISIDFDLTLKLEAKKQELREQQIQRLNLNNITNMQSQNEIMSFEKNKFKDPNLLQLNVGSFLDQESFEPGLLITPRFDKDPSKEIQITSSEEIFDPSIEHYSNNRISPINPFKETFEPINTYNKMRNHTPGISPDKKSYLEFNDDGTSSINLNRFRDGIQNNENSFSDKRGLSFYLDNPDTVPVSTRTTFKGGNVYLRKDLQADGDDKQSDKTMISIFNQYQSQNTSFIGADADNQFFKNKKEPELVDIDKTEIRVEYLQTEEIDTETNEWLKMVNEVKKSINKNPDQDKSTGVSPQKTQLFLRHLIKKKSEPVATKENQFLDFQSTSTKTFLNSENPLLLEDNIMFLILIGKKSFHTYLISDQLANRCRIVFKNLIKKTAEKEKSECHEAYFGLAKIYFHLNKLDIAYDCIKQAGSIRPNDDVYKLWQGLISYYLISYSQLGGLVEDQHTVRKWITECEQSLLQVLRINKNSLAALFILLKLTTYVEKYSKRFASIRFKKSARDYALKISKIDQYLGYIAWAEIYISQREKRNTGIQVLEDLIKDKSSCPQAYLKLWNVYYINKNKAKVLEIAERLFIYGSGYSSIEIKIIIALLYAKSLYMNQEYHRCFELLQNEFMNFPQFSTLLYAYAKYVVDSASMNYFGSAIGALEECIRSQVKERHWKIFYYLGKAYQKLNQCVKVEEFWSQAMKAGARKSRQKRTEIKDYLAKIQSITDVVQKVDQQVYWRRKGMKSQTAQLKEEALNFLKKIENFELLDSATKIFYQAKIQAYLLNEVYRAKELFEKCIEEHPFFLEAQVTYWHFLTKRKEYQRAKMVAEKALQASESTQVPTSLWVETRIILSKSYVIDTQIDKAVDTLKDICFLLPPFPIEELAFIDQVIAQRNQQEEMEVNIVSDNKNSQVDRKDCFSFAQVVNNQGPRKHQTLGIVQSSLNDLPNGFFTQRRYDDNIQKAYDYQIQICESLNQSELEESKDFHPQMVNDDIFEFASKGQDPGVPQFPQTTRNQNQMKGNQIFFSNRQSLCINDSQVDSQSNFFSLRRSSQVQRNLQSKKLSKFSFAKESSRRSICNMTESQMKESICNSTVMNEQVLDSEGFAIYSNIKFLSLIGKICAETGQQLEDGLNALNDYLQIIEYYREDVPEETYEKLKLKATYYIGMIFYKEKDYEMCQQYLSEILVELKDKGYKQKFEKAQNKLAKIYRRSQKDQSFEGVDDTQVHQYKELMLNPFKHSFDYLQESAQNLLNYHVSRIYCERTGLPVNNIKNLQENDILYCPMYEETIEVSDGRLSPNCNNMMIELNKLTAESYNRHIKDSMISAKFNHLYSAKASLAQVNLKKLNIAILGDSGVGKSSIINRYIFSTFDNEYSSTIEDLYQTQIKIVVSAPSYESKLDVPKNQQEQHYQLEITDTAGMDEFKNLRDSSLKQRDGYIFVYDQSKPSSLKKLEHILKIILAQNENQKKVPLLIVGNKNDLESVVTQDDVRKILQSFESQFNYQIISCSAKQGSHINDVFQTIVQIILNNNVIIEKELFQNNRKNQSISQRRVTKTNKSKGIVFKCCNQSLDKKSRCEIF